MREHDIAEEEEDRKSPLVYIAALFIVFLLSAGLFPYYYLKADPEPSVIVEIDDLPLPAGLNASQDRTLLRPSDPYIKTIATRIATAGCDSEKICQAKAQYYFVRDRFTYVSEYEDYIETPEEMMLSRGGDCDDHAVLLANLLRAIGIYTEFVNVPRHLYVKAYLPDAPSKYTDKYGWIYLDPTCKSCDFGQIQSRYVVDR